MHHPVGSDPSRGQNGSPTFNSAPVGFHAAYGSILDDHGFHIFTGPDDYAAFKQCGAHAVDMVRQTIAAQMLLPDEEQINAVLLGFLADSFRALHIRRNTGASMPNLLKIVSVSSISRSGFRTRHELGEIRLAELVNEIKLAVGKQTAASHPRQNMTRVAVHALVRLSHGTAPLSDQITSVDQTDRQTGMLGQPPGGKQTRRPAADNYDIKRICHEKLLNWAQHQTRAIAGTRMNSGTRDALEEKAESRHGVQKTPERRRKSFAGQEDFPAGKSASPDSMAACPPFQNLSNDPQESRKGELSGPANRTAPGNACRSRQLDRRHTHGDFRTENTSVAI